VLRVFLYVFAYMSIIIGILGIIGFSAWLTNRYVDKRDAKRREQDRGRGGA
jgi:flagellar biogenesis protein FliO